MEAKIQNTVPKIIALYWVIKIAATTLGETGADLFSMTLNIGYDLTILLFLSFFILSLVIKIRQSRYTPLLYWVTFTTSAIAGTAMSDYIDRTYKARVTGSSPVFYWIATLIYAGQILWYLEMYRKAQV